MKLTSCSRSLVLALVLSFPAVGFAGSIPVTNYSFETPVQAVGTSSSGVDGNTTAVPGWTISGQNFGVSNPGTSVPDGSQIAVTSVQGGTAALTTTSAVTTIVASTTYTATVQVTNPDNTNDNGTYTICFLDNGQIEGSASVAESTLATGTYVPLTATYTPASANVGHSLSIRLSFTGGTGGAPVQGLFDNVQLTTSSGVNGTATPIAFTLPSSATTTGGIYDSSGNLIRTLWRKVYCNAGPQTQVWDGNDDFGNPVAAGSYTAKVLYHNLHYVWDGVIGNTSASFDPSYSRHSFNPIVAMAVSGTSGFEAHGYNEGAYTMDRFTTTAPQAYAAQYGDLGEGTYSVVWQYAATDGTKVYYACPGLNDTTAQTYTKPGRIIAYNLIDNSSYTFSSGSSFYNIPDWLQAARPGLGYWPSGVPVGTQVGLSAIAVQATGNYLAVAVAPDNEVYLLDKNSGASLGSFSVTSPKGLAFDPNGDLWVLTGTSAIRYTSISTTPTVATTITGFSSPLAVAVHPSNADIVLIADGGTAQQVKGYTHLGAKATGWSSNLGTLGGNKLAGPAVTNTKFWFTGGNDLNGFGTMGELTYLAINTDGSFWLGDGGNNRSLHFSSAKAYIEQIAFLPDTLSCNIDANNSARVFAGFLEYAVDYTKPILPGDPYATGGNKSWHLVNNWAGNVSSTYFGFQNGVRNPVTMSNGHTYCILYSPSNITNVAELTSTGVRMVGSTTLDPLTYMYELQADGSARYSSISGGTATWYSVPLTGFDGSNNPQWAALPGTSLCSAPGGANDPAPQGNGDGQRRYPTTASNIMVSFDNGTTNTGMHLGGVPLGGTAYQWEAAPTGVLDYLGTYDDSATYAGSVTVVSGRSIIYGYNGEFGPGTESNQFMHFLDDGLFVGEFGTLGSTANPTAGGAGNSFSLQMVNVSGEKYAWHNDESAHGGLHRWHLLGEPGILEASGSGALGSTINITVPPPVFPVNVVALPASGKAVLSWSAVAGASAYKVKYSTTRGGPYTTLSSSVTATTYTKTGLTNGTNYYFTVSAVVGGVESPNSDEAKLTPYDLTVAVQTAGWLYGGDAPDNNHYENYPITSINPTLGLPAFPAVAEDILGTLHQYQVGSQGYSVFSQGFNYSTDVITDNVNLTYPLIMTKGTGWSTASYLSEQMTIDGMTEIYSGSLYYAIGVSAGASKSITITSPDNNWHLLTVFDQPSFNAPQSYTLTLTPQGLSSPAATYTVTPSATGIGDNYWFQYLFQGNVTLTMNGLTGGTYLAGNIQGIFVDGVNVALTPVAPANLTASAGVTQVSLAWPKVANATSYNIYRGTTAGGESSTAIATGVTLPNYTDTGLTTGTHYYYKIKAVNGVGTSAYSNEANTISL